jgi:pimeloyl-ACP methyl ester carboxylesterase
MKGIAAVVLIPGAGMSSWVWRDVVDRISLPTICIGERLAQNTYVSRKTSSLGDCVDHALSILDASGYDSFIVVGHSGAGPIAAMLAQALGDRAERLVLVAANLPPHGRTMIDSLPWAIKLINVLAIRRMIKKDSTPMARLGKVIREKFCNDSPESVIEYVLSQEMRSEPLCAITERMDWSGYRSLPRTYILLTRDGTLSIPSQRAMAGNLGIEDFVEIESDHMAMLSHPAEFARAINDLAAAPSSRPRTRP